MHLHHDMHICLFNFVYLSTCIHPFLPVGSSKNTALDVEYWVIGGRLQAAGGGRRGAGGSQLPVHGQAGRQARSRADRDWRGQTGAQARRQAGRLAKVCICLQASRQVGRRAPGQESR